jgi:hypothetical protein
MIQSITIIEQDPTGAVKVGVKFNHNEPTPDEVEFAAEFNMILEAYSKEKGKFLDGGEVQTQPTVLAENVIPTVKMMINHMKHSGKSWEELEPYMIEQLSGAVFREVKETEMKEYNEYSSDNAGS